MTLSNSTQEHTLKLEIKKILRFDLESERNENLNILQFAYCRIPELGVFIIRVYT